MRSEAVRDDVGEKTMVQGGIESPYKHEYPPGVDSLEGALETLNEVNNQAHRGSEMEYPAGNT